MHEHGTTGGGIMLVQCLCITMVREAKSLCPAAFKCWGIRFCVSAPRLGIMCASVPNPNPPLAAPTDEAFTDEDIWLGLSIPQHPS